MTAPTMPPLLWLNTAPRIISQRVAPSASAASFSSGGVVSNTSRVSEVMIGMIMIARMIPAVKNARPLVGPSNSAPITGIGREHVADRSRRSP